MEAQIKQRVVGGIVVVVVLMLFLPVLLYKPKPVVGLSASQPVVSKTSSVPSPSIAADANLPNSSGPIKFQLPAQPASPPSNKAVAVAAVSGSSTRPARPTLSMAPGSKKVHRLKEVTQSKSAVEVASSKKVVAATAPRSSKLAKVPLKKSRRIVAKQKISIKNAHGKITASKISKSQAQAQVKRSSPPVKLQSTLTVNQMLVPKSMLNTQAWVLQLASFSNSTYAKQLLAKLRTKGFDGYSKTITNQSGKHIVRVFVGPEIKRAAIDHLQKVVAREFKLKGLVRRYKL